MPKKVAIKRAAGSRVASTNVEERLTSRKKPPRPTCRQLQDCGVDAFDCPRLRSCGEHAGTCGKLLDL